MYALFLSVNSGMANGIVRKRLCRNCSDWIRKNTRSKLKWFCLRHIDIAFFSMYYQPLFILSINPLYVMGMDPL